MTIKSNVRLHFPAMDMDGDMDQMRAWAERLDGMLLIGATVKWFRHGVTAHFPEADLRENLKTVLDEFDGCDFTVTYP